MQHSTERILTTHVGSIVRPPAILDIMRGREVGKPFSAAELATIDSEVKAAVQQQADCGIDIPSDGEFSKSSFSGYVSDRLSGYELVAGETPLGGSWRGRDRKRFREAYEEMEGRTGSPASPVCTGPISYQGQALVEQDLARFSAATAGLNFAEAFVPAVGPGTIELQRRNAYYQTQEDYLFAIAEAMKTEYQLIVNAGFILQIDDPRLMTEYDSLDPAPDHAEYRKFLALRVEALNHALAGLPADRIRYHICWGSWHGPHSTDVELKEVIDEILKVRAGAFSVESANPRHAHEYHVWENRKLADGLILIPGVIAHTTNHVEHPELVAERIVRWANIAGKENVVAGIDCGFAQGVGTVRVHASIMWEKFRMLAEGAALASKQLF